MTKERANELIGEMVMSRDAGTKMIKCVPEHHGPYKLIGVTKNGKGLICKQKGWVSVPLELLEEVE